MPTKIEWCDETWNPVTGCDKVSAGCKHCYAKYKAWPRLSAMPGTVYHGRDFEQVMCHPERLDQPLRWTKPRLIFVNSMSDLFHPDVPDSFIDEVFAVMALAPQHTFQVLTKRPERMREYLSRPAAEVRIGLQAMAMCLDSVVATKGRSELGRGISLKATDINPGGLAAWPLPNVWLGVSVEDQAAADERIPLLLQTPAAVRWISAEPLLGPVDLNCIEWLRIDGSDHFDALTTQRHLFDDVGLNGAALDWVVSGGESGPKARPTHPAWARSLRDQCAAAGVPFLFKQWGEYMPGMDASNDQIDAARAGGWVRLNGGFHDGNNAEEFRHGDIHVLKAGKKSAGRLLDGIQHDGYPAAAPRTTHRPPPPAIKEA